ncbi:MAG TPA: Hpt domain-containing protein [Rhodocyclaceae bacterium]|nr:Hpt domain-containing protein [Rhodocyclaceae bacterium]
MATNMARIHDLFFAECEELLVRAEHLLSAGACRAPDRGAAVELHRCLHSISGAACMLGFEAVAALAGVFERGVERLRDGSLRPDREIDKAALSGIFALRAGLADCRDGTRHASGIVETARIELARLCADERTAVHPGGDIELELRFAVSRVVCSEVLLDDMLEQLHGLGRVVRVERAEEREDGQWCIRIATDRPLTTLRDILDKVVEPGTLRIGRADRAEDAAAVHEHADTFGAAVNAVLDGAAELVANAQAQVDAFGALLQGLRDARGDRTAWREDGVLVESLRRVGMTIRRGERLAATLAASVELFARVAEQRRAVEALREVEARPGATHVADAPVIDERPLRSRRQTARISPLPAARRRLGTPVPKIRRAAGARSAMEVDWERIGE